MRFAELELRLLIKEQINDMVEACWEDPSVVVAAKNISNLNDELDGEESTDEDPSDPSWDINKSADEQLRLNSRNNYKNDNRGLGSSKPVAPRNPGGPQSGRSPGGKRATPMTGRNSGY